MTIPTLPLPEKLEPKNVKRTLMGSVRIYFYALYNAANSGFQDFLKSVGNKDSETGNRYFDRHIAVGMIKKAAEKSQDTITATAKDGDVYSCLVKLMGKAGIGLKLRREQYKEIMHKAPAE